jgi:CTP synthase
MEILELKDHPWFVGVQFHPEYLSRVLRPSKPFLGFVAAAAGCLETVLKRATDQGGGKGSGKDEVNGDGI